MIALQILVNGILLGGIYASIAGGFSLVWGVLNVINILHGSFVVLGAYLAFFAYTLLGIHPYLFVPIAALGTIRNWPRGSTTLRHPRPGRTARAPPVRTALSENWRSRIFETSMTTGNLLSAAAETPRGEPLSGSSTSESFAGG